ncbi:MAG: hypothetical protein A2648_00940 [Candidatus Lloydbacteria bacterium RIFCSPHIGHO2_01_FULL_41_20]|uniref:Glycosyl transferase family 1 domain-containing protein n=1 Tax=Candidatus Lloydbacteria bacterium RIFCSPHIGHO2_01_FULL_41_20 TaxID=1798657 RepID=A0A1G2CTD6_9BACT|nr:MAG: hypothetical protein A2648_00940 [Candidatus Lloydbacteria bacterium RIFCSPHIGHO2_01_FULL_41_20]
MRLVYITGKTYPGNTADHHYIRQLALGFSSVLGGNMQFVAQGNIDFLNKESIIQTINISWLKNSIFFFFWILFFAIKNFKNLNDIVFFSNDSYILSILIIWRKIFNFKYKICSDWHHLFHDFRDKFIAVNSDEIVTTSKKLKENIIKITKISPSKIATIYGGVDLNLYSMDKIVSKKSLGLPEDKIIIGYVGLFKTLGLEKGILTMISSLKHLPDKFMVAFVGGTDNEIKEYKKFADSLGVKERCIFWGRKIGGDVAKYQMAMDILAIPYPDKPHFRESGFPMKVYEYMASKKPILYSKLDLVEEVLSDCAIGFIAGDAVDFSLKIKDIVENNFYPEFVSKAYLKLDQYTWKSKASYIIDFIKQK